MAKNFSVAWLSQSSHRPAPQQEHSPNFDGVQSHMPCLVDSRTLVSNEDPSYVTHREDVSDNVKDLARAPSSPTSKQCEGLSYGYSSGSESEVCDDGEQESGPNRRVRTKFTSYQISRLEKTFSKHKYLGVSQRRKTAEKLHLSETQVKTWFQNRRMKLKREVQDTRTEYFAASLLSHVVFPSPLSFQNHVLTGQRLSLLPGVYSLYPQHLSQRHYKRVHK
uniref:Homeobox domain-containing protein n=1 Tax=Electrophorus electricus TaxID=8005 RepID=A0A4W4ENU5_ELEEL